MTKKQKSKIIKFPTSYSEQYSSSDEYEDDDFEGWEVDYELLDKKDYEGLLQYRKQRAKRKPNEYYAQYYLGEAYILNKNYETAIDFLSKLHKQYPDSHDFKHLLLDGLFALGKDENDFDWIEKPVVLRLTKTILDACYEYLKPKRKPRSVDELHCNFITEGYLAFSRMDLFYSLIEDGRFMVEDTEFPYLAEIQVVRKNR